MTSKKIDPRVRKTQAAFKEALLTLLQKKRLEKIQIKEIAAAADLSRHAFYSHFDSKEALLFSYVDDVFAGIRAALYVEFEKVDNADPIALYTRSFELWKQHAKMLQYVMQVNDKDLLISRLRQHVADIVELALEDKKVASPQHPMHDFILDYLAGGGYMLLRKWMKTGMQQSPAEMAQLFHQITPFELLLGKAFPM